MCNVVIMIVIKILLYKHVGFSILIRGEFSGKNYREFKYELFTTTILC